MPLPALAPEKFAPRPWAPLTDREFAVLATWLPGHDGRRRGRPVKDLRRTLDALFWTACSTRPWRALPAHLGKADSASRLLRRWAREGVLDGLVIAVSRSRLAQGCAVLRGMGYWFARLFRRMARVVYPSSLSMVLHLGVADAWPKTPLWLPRADLSKTTRRLVRAGEGGLRGTPPEVARSAARMVFWAQRFLGKIKTFRRGWTLC